MIRWIILVTLLISLIFPVACSNYNSESDIPEEPTVILSEQPIIDGIDQSALSSIGMSSTIWSSDTIHISGDNITIIIYSDNYSIRYKE